MCFECSLSESLLNNNNQNGDSALRYLCRTNAYGPTDSIFHDCHRFEAGSASASGQIRMFSLFSSKCTSAPNPSLSEPLCMKFAKVCCFFSILVLQFLKGKVFEEKKLLTFICFSLPQGGCQHRQAEGRLQQGQKGGRTWRHHPSQGLHHRRDHQAPHENHLGHRCGEDIYSQVILNTAEGKQISCFPENVAKLAENVSKFSWNCQIIKLHHSSLQVFCIIFLTISRINQCHRNLTHTNVNYVLLI